MPSILTHDSSAQAICEAPPEGRLVEATGIRLSEIIAAMSVALDITQGHPQGHCMRTALVGMRLADALRLPTADRSALFYALLMKDLGCSSNAAKMTCLFAADDHLMKRDLRMIDWTKTTDSLRFLWRHSAAGGSVLEKLLKMASIAAKGAEVGRRLSETRCERGADIARMLGLPESSARAIRELDEHWNGGGTPCSLKGEEISLLARICCLAQTVEIFFTTYSLEAAMDVARQRRGQWFDPQLVDALLAFQDDAPFWQKLFSDDLTAEISRVEPEDAVLTADEARIDRVAEAFARVVDAKSPWTFQHSTRVAEVTVGIVQQFGCSPELERDMHRAALLHDIGKLGVSNLILDKPGRPTDEEMAQIRKHPDYSQQILEKVAAFRNLADVASAHHERIDGRGYHRRLAGSRFPWAARVLAVADMYEAMSARRPYREAMPWSQIQEILHRDAGSGVDPECLQALERWLDRHAMESRVDAQLAEVDRMVAELF
jgi:putative nucleotidyltransferase with HDIG domain